MNITQARIRIIPFSSIPPLVWCIGLGALLRLVNLAQEPFWYDESFTAWIARLPWSQAWPAIKGDVHPPLWYAIEWALVHVFGESEYLLRLPATLFGLACIWLIYELAREISQDNRVATTAAFFAAIFPGGLYYSQDARMYPMLSFFVLAAALAAIRQRWGYFVLVGIGAVYSQHWGILYFGGITLASVAGFVLKRDWRGALVPIASAAMVALAWLPWLPVMLDQLHSVGQGYWLQPITVGGMVYPLMQMVMGNRLYEGFAIHVYLVALVMCGFSLLICRQWLKLPNGLIIAGFVLIAPLIGALFSVIWRSIYVPRALLPVAYGFMILWSYAIFKLSPANRIAAMLVLAPALGIGVASHYLPSQGLRSEGQIMNTIKARWQPGDVIYYLQIDGAVGMNYYAPNLPYALMPESTDLSQSLTGQTKQAMGLNQQSFDSLATKGYHRAWLVVNRTPMISRIELNELSRLITQYPAQLLIKDEHIISDNELYLLELRPIF